MIANDNDIDVKVAEDFLRQHAIIDDRQAGGIRPRLERLNVARYMAMFATYILKGPKKYEDDKNLGPIPIERGEDTRTIGDMMTKNKKSCYISGKITGIESVATQLFSSAEERLLETGVDVVNPLNLIHIHDQSWESFMKVDLKAMMDCDSIYMLSNWETSKGATVEHDLAKKLGMEIIYEVDSLPELKA